MRGKASRCRLGTFQILGEEGEFYFLEGLLYRVVPLLGSSYGPVLRTESSNAVPRARGRGLHLGSFTFLSVPFHSLGSVSTFRRD